MRTVTVLARVRWVLLRVIGAPDYEAYVRRLWEKSPGALPIPRARFEQERVEARHQRIGGRCC
jgi:uncharacterized short protein YbdD (DUF466 family)